MGMKKYSSAIEHMRRALQINKSYPEAFNNLGLALREVGLPDEAIHSFRKALAFRPDCAETLNNLGLALREAGQPNEAVLALQKALNLRADYPEALNNLGLVLRDEGLWEEAALAFRRALHFRPDYTEALNNLGLALHDRGEFDAAIIIYKQALQLKPDYASACNNLGNTLKSAGRHQEAIALYRRAVRINPDYAEAHWNMAMALLLTGDFTEGWKEYEWRRRLKDFGPSQNTDKAPLWDGSAVTGRTILLRTEQGFGDNIQFIRYADLLSRRGARVIVECRQEMAELLKRAEGVSEVAVRGGPVPDHDFYCPLLTLPLLFCTLKETIPGRTPYLSADPSLVSAWHNKIQSSAHGLKVGIAWAGTYPPGKSCSLNDLAPLSDITPVTFYSLQKGGSAQEAITPPAYMRLVDMTGGLHDFADTAALIENLDLVISIDTAVAHLAGALNKTTWVLLHSDADWRWLLHREDSPWYPSMRLFRRAAWESWPAVTARIKDELAHLCSRKAQ
jgi:tetratricopeptide (TPR) repeat protein